MISHEYLQSLNPPVLIFVQSKERAKELYEELVFDNIRANVIHSDLAQMQVIDMILIFISQDAMLTLTGTYQINIYLFC